MKGRRPSATTIIAVLALTLALGGTSYAAFSLPRNSVGTNQLKNGAVTEGKLKDNAVTSSKIVNGSLLAKDFRSGQLPAGPVGPAGPAGGFSTANVSQATGPVATMCPLSVTAGDCIVGASLASCPIGAVILGGGWDGGSEPPVLATVAYNQPLGTDAWEVIMATNTDSISQSFNAVAMCATATGARVVAHASKATLTSAQRDQLGHDLAAARAAAAKR